MPAHDCKKEMQEISFTGQCVVAIEPVLDGHFIQFGSDINMTREDCRDNCGHYAYFGLRNGNECFCGNDLRLPLDVTFDAECPLKCPGDRLQSCGGPYRMNLWSREKSYMLSDFLNDDEFVNEVNCGNWKIAPKREEPPTDGSDENYSTQDSCFFYNNKVFFWPKCITLK